MLTDSAKREFKLSFPIAQVYKYTDSIPRLRKEMDAKIARSQKEKRAYFYPLPQ